MYPVGQVSILRLIGHRRVPRPSPASPLWGLWHPDQQSQAEKDDLTRAEVLANPIEPANRFFAGLKPILKTGGHIEQKEILIAWIECRLT